MFITLRQKKNLEKKTTKTPSNYSFGTPLRKYVNTR